MHCNRHLSLKLEYVFKQKQAAAYKVCRSLLKSQCAGAGSGCGRSGVSGCLHCGDGAGGERQDDPGGAARAALRRAPRDARRAAGRGRQPAAHVPGALCARAVVSLAPWCRWQRNEGDALVQSYTEAPARAGRQRAVLRGFWFVRCLARQTAGRRGRAGAGGCAGAALHGAHMLRKHLKSLLPCPMFHTSCS